ncbi:hypothetical protein [Klebsiella variicola]|uniref:hypothetical protein n=1 Tax=Klebsiella variicola TaxID=244366 RepID=UPI001D19204F|nr:hypothetical protein [Klebsiella variicola]
MEPAASFFIWSETTQNTNDNDEIAGDRMAQGVSRGTVDVGGDVVRGFAGTSMTIFLPAVSVPNG